MKHLKLLLALALLAIAVPIAISTARGKSSDEYVGTRTPANMKAPAPLRPEPSRVYGYISLVDPTTSVKHLILDTDYDPPVVLGHPRWHVVFRSTDRGEVHRVTFSRGEGLNTIGVPATALLYFVPLVQDRAESAATPRRVTREGYHRFLIRYNPDRWNFDSVEMEPYEYIPAGGDGRTRERIPLSQRATPFSEYANIPEGRDLP